MRVYVSASLSLFSLSHFERAMGDVIEWDEKYFGEMFSKISSDTFLKAMKESFPSYIKGIIRSIRHDDDIDDEDSHTVKRSRAIPIYVRFAKVEYTTDVFKVSVDLCTTLDAFDHDFCLIDGDADNFVSDLVINEACASFCSCVCLRFEDFTSRVYKETRAEVLREFSHQCGGRDEAIKIICSSVRFIPEVSLSITTFDGNLPSLGSCSKSFKRVFIDEEWLRSL